MGVPLRASHGWHPQGWSYLTVDGKVVGRGRRGTGVEGDDDHAELSPWRRSTTSRRCPLRRSTRLSSPAHPVSLIAASVAMRTEAIRCTNARTSPERPVTPNLVLVSTFVS
jgi:hypothetical protein